MIEVFATILVVIAVILVVVAVFLVMVDCCFCQNTLPRNKIES